MINTLLNNNNKNKNKTCVEFGIIHLNTTLLNWVPNNIKPRNTPWKKREWKLSLNKK